MHGIKEAEKSLFVHYFKDQFSNSLSRKLCTKIGRIWRRPYGILIAGMWSSLAEKMADMAEKLAQPFTQS